MKTTSDVAHARDTTPADYKKKFLSRIKETRQAMPAPPGKKKFTQADMAKALGIEQDHYKQFESRSIMPLYLLADFCRITDMHPWFVLTGESGSRSPGSFPSRPTLTPVGPRRT